MSSPDHWSMQRAAWITLGMLGGGLTLVAVLGEQAHERRCAQMGQAGIAGSDGNCQPRGGGGHGGGYRGSWTGAGSAETDDAAHSSVVRGGFGAFGEGFGGGSAGE